MASGIYIPLAICQYRYDVKMQNAIGYIRNVYLISRYIFSLKLFVE
jgi:hypothetical protein